MQPLNWWGAGGGAIGVAEAGLRHAVFRGPAKTGEKKSRYISKAADSREQAGQGFLYKKRDHLQADGLLYWVPEDKPKKLFSPYCCAE